MVADTNQILRNLRMHDFEKKKIYSNSSNSPTEDMPLSNGIPNGVSNGIHKQNGTTKANEIILMANGRPPYSSEGIYPDTFQKAPMEECSLITTFCNFLSMALIVVIGYIKEFFIPPSLDEVNREGYAPLYVGFQSFFARNVYRRIQLCFNTPICSNPGTFATIMTRDSPDNGWTIIQTTKKKECLNIGSYNYLGLGDKVGPCRDMVEVAIKRDGVACSSPRLELGTMAIHQELEKVVAEFMGMEAAITVGMGYATNVTNLPALLDKNSLVVSDEFNHISLILGSKLSGATVKVFQHNDYDHLEKILRESIIKGHPRTNRPWNKIIILIEGIYSMEGTICDLPKLIKIKKKYKAYLYLDEAHSIGALGPHGRGVVDYFNCDPEDVDILMGTFTKCFGSAGGYISGKKELIDHLKSSSHAQTYSGSMSPALAQQIITSMNIVMGKDGTNEGEKRLRQLAKNTRYMRCRLKERGFIISGNEDSPVVPLMIFSVPKIFPFVQGLFSKGIISVGVGFPATKLSAARMRFCLSAGHTKEMLDYIIDQIDIVGGQIVDKTKNPPAWRPIDC